MKRIPETLEHESRRERDAQVFACFQQVLGHDLVNHLVAAQGLASLLSLEEAEALKPESKIYLERLAAAIGRVHNGIAALADICRARSASPQHEMVSIPEVAREVAAELSKLHPGRSVDFAITNREMILSAPRAAIRRILTQLMRNALQARREDRPCRIEVGAGDEAENADWWVADNGRGMSLDTVEQVRDFFNGRTGTKPGGGLGLLVVRESLDSIDASILVESTLGQGTTFTVQHIGEAAF